MNLSFLDSFTQNDRQASVWLLQNLKEQVSLSSDFKLNDEDFVKCFISLQSDLLEIMFLYYKNQEHSVENLFDLACSFKVSSVRNIINSGITHKNGCFADAGIRAAAAEQALAGRSNGSHHESDRVKCCFLVEKSSLNAFFCNIYFRFLQVVILIEGLDVEDFLEKSEKSM